MPPTLSFDRTRADNLPAVAAHFARSLCPLTSDCVRVTATAVFGLHGLAEDTNLAGGRCGVSCVGATRKLCVYVPGHVTYSRIVERCGRTLDAGHRASVKKGPNIVPIFVSCDVTDDSSADVDVGCSVNYVAWPLRCARDTATCTMKKQEFSAAMIGRNIIMNIVIGVHPLHAGLRICTAIGYRLRVGLGGRAGL